MNRTAKDPDLAFLNLQAIKEMLYFIANYLEIKSKGDAKP